jgi:hypothetical protein
MQSRILMASATVAAMPTASPEKENKTFMNVPLRPNRLQTAVAALILALAAYGRYRRHRVERDATVQDDVPPA